MTSVDSSSIHEFVRRAMLNDRGSATQPGNGMTDAPEGAEALPAPEASAEATQQPTAIEPMAQAEEPTATPAQPVDQPAQPAQPTRQAKGQQAQPKQEQPEFANTPGNEPAVGG